MSLLPSRSELVIATAVVAVTVLLVLGLAWLLWLIGEIILVVLVAAVLATGLNPVVEAVQRRTWTRRRRQLSRGASVAVVYLGLLVALGLMGSLFVGPMVSESQEFVQRAPALYARLLEMLTELQQRYTWLPDMTAVLNRLPQEAGRLTTYVGAATGVAFRVFGAVVFAVTVLILSIYMLLEGPEIRAGFLRLFPPAHHPQVESVLRGVSLKFGGWLRGQLFLGLIVGLAAGLGTWILGLPYPFLLGLAAGITELIPIIGPILGAIPAVFVALFGPVWRLVAVVALFAGIQQLENNVLVPRVMKQSVGLSPVLTIVAIMVGVKLIGVLGALLAVPIAAALQVIIGEVLQTVRREKIGMG